MSNPIDTSKIEALARAADVQSQSESTARRPSPFGNAQMNNDATLSNIQYLSLPSRMLGSSSRFGNNKMDGMANCMNQIANGMNMNGMNGMNNMNQLSNNVSRRASMPAAAGAGIGARGFKNCSPPLGIPSLLPTDYEFGHHLNQRYRGNSVHAQFARNALRQSILANEQQLSLSTASSNGFPSSGMIAHDPDRPSADYPTNDKTSPDAHPPSAKKNRRKPNFAEKLHVVLSTSSNNHLAHWLPNGDAFLITDTEEFAKQILPKYMREAKFDSFTRRMKRWGFVKRHTSKAKQMVFMHELFKRDRFDLCKNMHGRDKLLKDDEEEEVVPQPMKNSHPSHPGITAIGNMGEQTTSRMPNPVSAINATAAISITNQNNNHDNNMMFQRRMSDMTPREYLLRRELMKTVAMRRELEMMNRHVLLQQMPPQGPNMLHGGRFSPNNLQDFQGQSLPSSHQGSIYRQGLHFSQSEGYHRQATRKATAENNSDTSSHLMAIKDDIRECEEKLALLQKLKTLKEKKRMLAEANAALEPKSNSSY